MSIQSTISNPLWPEFNLTLRMHPLKLSRIKIERDVDDSEEETHELILKRCFYRLFVQMITCFSIKYFKVEAND